MSLLLEIFYFFDYVCNDLLFQRRHARQLIEQTILRNASPDRQLSEDLHRM